MIDPLTAVNLATEGLSICIKVISILKRYASAVKNVKQELVDLLKRVEHMRNLFGLLRSLSLTLELHKTQQSLMQLEIDKKEYEQTMEDLLSLASEVVAKKTFFAGLYWGTKKNAAVRLTEKLRHQEEQIINVVTIIGTTSSLKTQLDVEALRKDAVTHSELQSAFENLSIVDGALQVPVGDSGEYKRLRTWLGHVLREGFSEDYLIWRDTLSEAAYCGNWDGVWTALDTGDGEYSESWLSAVRLKSLAGSNQMSFWTPLHQAVYNRAPIEVVRRLISAGAFRTLRSKWTEYSYRDMNPLELARELGFTYLYDILSPVIRNPLPLRILETLEEHFHNIIRCDLGDRVTDERMYLPVLEVLTEIGNETMWFPVKFTYSSAGYAYRLYERVLIVKSINIGGEDVSRIYNITETGAVEVDGATVSGD